MIGGGNGKRFRGEEAFYQHSGSRKFLPNGETLLDKPAVCHQTSEYVTSCENRY